MTHRVIAIAGVFSLISLNWGCTKDKNSTPPPSPKGPSIQVATNATLGTILTDSTGRTLYFFSPDASGNSTCTGGCLTAWPLFYKQDATFGSTLNASDFGTVTRPDGSPQTTYKGWPIYYYQNDARAGDVNGEGLNNNWFVAKPDYTVMLASGQLLGLDGKQYTDQYVAGTATTQYLTDAYGRTLYAFKPDKFRKNTFTKPDFSNNAVWPIDSLAPIAKVPSIVDKTLFDTIHVAGRVQLTFKGWPLYYFGKDSARRGNTRGVSFPTPGTWPIVNNNSATAPQ